MNTLPQWHAYHDFKSLEKNVRDYYHAVGHCTLAGLQQLESRAYDRALDIACGAGDSTTVLQHLARNIVGVDSSQTLIDQAKQRPFDVPVEFHCCAYDDFEPVSGQKFDLIAATWFLNHIHGEEHLEKTIARICSQLAPDGHAVFVVPSDAFTSTRIQQIAREQFNWEQAWLEQQPHFTRGVFSYGHEWIRTTIWQPKYLMRCLRQHFDIHALDVKTTLLENNLLPEFHAEPPFEVLYGTRKAASPAGSPPPDRSEKVLPSPRLRGEGPGVRGSDKGLETDDCPAQPSPTDKAGKISFSAGSASHRTDGYRTIQPDAAARVTELLSTFPELAHFLNDRSLLISAYPATLGIEGVIQSVDTYLHPATFIRALRKAADEHRPVVIATQPLVGADLLLRFLQHDYRLPAKMMWAAGGTWFPQSLQAFVTDSLSARGCQLQVLHYYGIAEVAHTCFAALDRFECGLPRYHKVIGEVTATIDKADQQLILQVNERSIATGDWATETDGRWKIVNCPTRLAPDVRQQLESWSAFEWTRRTGYLKSVRETRSGDVTWAFQLRESIASGGPQELRYHEFWQQFGGSPMCKPDWSVERRSLPQ